MSDQENLDISKIVSLIMENPALIEQIANMAKSKTEETAPQTEESAEVISESKETEAKTESSPTYAPAINYRNDRAKLLCALKPYVSSERAKAIDSMISIADILDMMRSR